MSIIGELYCPVCGDKKEGWNYQARTCYACYLHRLIPKNYIGREKYVIAGGLTRATRCPRTGLSIFDDPSGFRLSDTICRSSVRRGR